MEAKERSWDQVSIVLPAPDPTLHVTNVSASSDRDHYEPACLLPTLKQTSSGQPAAKTHPGTTAVTLTLLNVGRGCRVGLGNAPFDV